MLFESSPIKADVPLTAKPMGLNTRAEAAHALNVPVVAFAVQTLIDFAISSTIYSLVPTSDTVTGNINPDCTVAQVPIVPLPVIGQACTRPPPVSLM